MPDVPQAMYGKNNLEPQFACLFEVTTDNVLNLKDKTDYSLEYGEIITFAASATS